MTLIDMPRPQHRRALRRLRERLANHEHLRRAREARKLCCVGVDLPLEAGTCGPDGPRRVAALLGAAAGCSSTRSTTSSSLSPRSSKTTPRRARATTTPRSPSRRRPDPGRPHRPRPIPAFVSEDSAGTGRPGPDQRRGIALGFLSAASRPPGEHDCSRPPRSAVPLPPLSAPSHRRRRAFGSPPTVDGAGNTAGARHPRRRQRRQEPDSVFRCAEPAAPNQSGARQRNAHGTAHTESRRPAAADRRAPAHARGQRAVHRGGSPDAEAPRRRAPLQRRRAHPRGPRPGADAVTGADPAPTASAEAVARRVELRRVGRLLNDATRALHAARGRPAPQTLVALRQAAEAVARQLGRWP